MPNGPTWGADAAAVAARPFDKWGEMEDTYHFVQEFKPELFGAKLKEATEERKTAERNQRREESHARSNATA
jgi:hypothetical protein